MYIKFINEFDAVQIFNNADNDATKSLAISYLSKTKSVKEIMHMLDITNRFYVSYLKRAGTNLSPTLLDIWQKNSHRISLGHIRAILKLKDQQRESVMRDILMRKLSVRQVENITQGKEENTSSDMADYERQFSEAIGSQVTVNYDPNSQTGWFKVQYYGLDDLEDKAAKLGFKPERY